MTEVRLIYKQICYGDDEHWHVVRVCDAESIGSGVTFEEAVRNASDKVGGLVFGGPDPW